MKLVTSFAIAALIAAPSVAMAQKSTTTTTNGPGQSEFAPGQRATTPGGATKFAPGQRQTTPGTAKNFAPGQQPHQMNTKNVNGGTTTTKH
jgi:hypothetical protein